MIVLVYAYCVIANKGHLSQILFKNRNKFVSNHREHGINFVENLVTVVISLVPGAFYTWCYILLGLVVIVSHESVTDTLNVKKFDFIVCNYFNIDLLDYYTMDSLHACYRLVTLVTKRLAASKFR